MNAPKTMLKIIRSPGWLLVLSLVVLQIGLYLFLLGNDLEVAGRTIFFSISFLLSVFWLRSNCTYMHLQRLRKRFYFHHAVVLVPQAIFIIALLLHFILDVNFNLFGYSLILCIIGMVYTGMILYVSRISYNGYLEMTSYSSNLENQRARSVSAWFRWSFWGITGIVALPLLVRFFSVSFCKWDYKLLEYLFFLFVFLVSVYPNIAFLIKKAWTGRVTKSLGFCTLLFMILVLALSISWVYIHTNSKPDEAIRFLFLRLLSLNVFMAPIGSIYLLYMHNPMPGKQTKRIALLSFPSGVFLFSLYILVFFLSLSSGEPHIFFFILLPMLVPVHLLVYLFLQQVYIDHLFKKD